MKWELQRLGLLVGAGFVFGLILGQALAGIILGLGLFAFLEIRNGRRLQQWLQEPGETEIPELGGYLGSAVYAVKSMLRHHRQREEKLEQYLTRFQEAASALPDAILILNDQDGIEWANHKAGEYLGIGWPQDAGQRLANLFRHPRLALYLKQRLSEYDTQGITLPSPENPDVQLEFRVNRYGDNLRLLVARDVSQIQQINQMRRDFIANASHELRSPLTVISGYLESMDGDEALSTADLQPRIRQMRLQASRMQSLIDDLLMLSSLERPEYDHHEGTVAVPDMLSVIHEEAVALSGERGHEFELDIDHELLLKGSHKELYSAFSNLVGNAVQYTSAGGKIIIRWYEDDSGAHMQVKDTGEGIAPEHIPRLTERFYRVDKGRSRDSGGTGLGLAIVKHIMHRHQARLNIRSELGRGSIFSCDFPPRTVVHKRDSAVESSG